MFDPSSIVDQLDSNARVFQALLANVSGELANYKSSNADWCILEIVCHLVDEEKEDFGARIKSTLTDPNQELAPIDPAGWPTARNYPKQNFEEKVAEFLECRQASTAWLRSLNNACWKNAYQHPEYGPLSAQLFLENWLAHDYLHIRQINRRKYEFHQQRSTCRLDYAGDW